MPETIIENILADYSEILQELEEKCQETQKGLPMIPCPNQCYDCCQQIFPVSFVEAYYLSLGFQKLERKERRNLQRQAEKVLKKNPQLLEEDFSIFNCNIEEISSKRNKYSAFLNEVQCNCPFLDEEKGKGKCTVYEYRNHDCRAHGYSYDGQSRELIACFRFPEIFPQAQEFIDKAFDYNYRYKDKLNLDQKLITYLTKKPEYKNLLYLTNPFTALLKNYQEYDWSKFFEDSIESELEENTYSLIIDNQIY